MGRVDWQNVRLIAALVAMCLYVPTVVSAQTTNADLSDAASLPAGLYPALIEAVQRDAPAGYEVVRRNEAGGGPAVAARAYRAPNPAHKFDVEFSTEGITLRARETEAWHLGMTLVGYGRGTDIRPVPPARVHVDGNRVEYRRGSGREGSRPALTEWYLNGPLGLEQGFTLGSPPPGYSETRGDLTVVLALSGGLVPELDAGGQAVRLTDPERGAALRYGGLYAYDAIGRHLPARMVLAASTLSIEVDAADAIYPVTIDPLLSEETKVTASDGAADDRFGGSVAISGDTVVVGAILDDDAGFASGSAYVFTRSGTIWSEQQKLTASDASANDAFGGSVAIDDDIVVVGARGNDDAGSNSGSAYVFTRSGTIWSEQQKLTASDAAAGDVFGSVAIVGNTVVVGASGNDDAGDVSGSAYVFVREGGVWSEQQKLTASDAAAGDGFGSVAIDSNTIVVGASGNEDAGSNSGSAYVFTRSGTIWSEQQKLTASDAADFDFFGGSVAISGDTVVVGADLDDDAGFNSGSAYVFTRSDTIWSEQQKLTASDAAVNDAFGGSVAIDGNTVIVGTIGDVEFSFVFSGAAYVFERVAGIWSEQQKLTASDAVPDDAFGRSVTISGDTVVVGANAPFNSGKTGAAYIFEPDADNDGVADAGDNCPANSNPGQEDNDTDGVGDVCDPDDDNDGVADVSDNCPVNSNPGQEDNETDGAGDVCDPDDDNDGMPDNFETANDFDPFDPSDAGQDADGDGFTNLEEFEGRSDPHDPDSVPRPRALPWLQLLLGD